MAFPPGIMRRERPLPGHGTAVHISLTRCADPGGKKGGSLPSSSKFPDRHCPSRELDSNCNGHSRLETSVRARRKAAFVHMPPVVPCARPDRHQTPLFRVKIRLRPTGLDGCPSSCQDARSGGASPPNPPDAKRHIPTKDLSKEGSSFVSTSLQFSDTTDLPSPTRAICSCPWIARNEGGMRTTARTPTLTFADPFQPPIGQLAAFCIFRRSGKLRPWRR